MPEELRTIKELGETQKHKKKNCNEFGKIVKLKASKSGVKLMYLCEKCNDNFIETYNNEEFVNMANGFLIDDEWVRDFQRKHMIVAQEFVPLKNGLDGAHFAEKSKVVKNWGEKFICECNDFYKMEFKGYKKQNLNFKLSCSDCSPKGKKLVIPTEKFFELGQAGVLPHDIVNSVREELIADEYKFDTGEGYYTPSTILSEKAKDVLEMGDHYAMKKCPKCKAFVDAEAPLCTECGHEF
jgi:hypothetical protein